MSERCTVHIDTDICSPEITYNFGFSELLAWLCAAFSPEAIVHHVEKGWGDMAFYYLAKVLNILAQNPVECPDVYIEYQ